MELPKIDWEKHIKWSPAYAVGVLIGINLGIIQNKPKQSGQLEPQIINKAAPYKVVSLLNTRELAYYDQDGDDGEGGGKAVLSYFNPQTGFRENARVYQCVGHELEVYPLYSYFPEHHPDSPQCYNGYLKPEHAEDLGQIKLDSDSK